MNKKHLVRNLKNALGFFFFSSLYTFFFFFLQ